MLRINFLQELSFEIGSLRGGTFLAWRRKSKTASCRSTTICTDGYWHHVVATLCYATGTSRFYVNGTFVKEYPGSELDALFRTVPPSGGELLVGLGLTTSTHYPPSAAGGAELTALTASSYGKVTTISSMALDDLRIHRRVLSHSEIAASVWMLPPRAPQDSLALHWSFDDPRPAVEKDLSGSGADGLRGSVQNTLDIGDGQLTNKLSIAPLIIGADQGTVNYYGTVLLWYGATTV